MAMPSSGEELTPGQRLVLLRALLQEALADLRFEHSREERLSTGDLRDLALGKIVDRKHREQAFGNDANLLFDPAWNIMLDLFANQGRRKVSVSAATKASRTPASTGLRWLRTLEERGLVHRHQHPTDARSRYVTLTDRGEEIVRHALEDGSAE